MDVQSLTHTIPNPNLTPNPLPLRSIRFYLQSEAEQRAAGAAHPVEQVQLRSRHWRIFDAAGELVDEIQGEGVVGQHPTLMAGDAAAHHRHAPSCFALPLYLGKGMM